MKSIKAANKLLRIAQIAAIIVLALVLARPLVLLYQAMKMEKPF
jgi:hypothetical protein